MVSDSMAFTAIASTTERCQTVRGDAGETVVANSDYFGARILLQPLPP